jgi:hypothetical protein
MGTRAFPRRDQKTGRGFSEPLGEGGSGLSDGWHCHFQEVDAYVQCTHTGVTDRRPGIERSRIVFRESRNLLSMLRMDNDPKEVRKTLRLTGRR